MRTATKMFFILFLISGFIIQSCNEEEIAPAPSIIVDPVSASNTPGNTVSADLTIEAPNGASLLTVYVAGVEVDAIDLTTTDLSAPVPYEYTIPGSALVGSTIVISFQVIDQKNYPSSIANFVVTVGDPVVTLQGILATQTLDAATPYLLKGQVFVPNGVILTIPAGTVIKGDKASKAVLVVQPGGKLFANGTADAPVVFTSSQALGERDRGDWGGVILLGNAWVNQSAKPAIEGISPAQTYGSVNADGGTPDTNADENSGSLTYVRIEYAGVELTPNNETNGLTLGAVGNGTTLDYIQVSYGGDDAFEWFGGTVNAKHLVSLSTWDDDFDTDFGWRGSAQFGLAVRNPFFADQSGSTAFESDNQANANDTPLGAAGYTQGVFSNFTIYGPRDYNAGVNNSTRTISGNYTRGIHIRRRSALSIFNSVITGWGSSTIPGLTMDDQATLDNFTNGLGVLSNNVLFHPNETALTEFGSSVSGAAGTTVKGFWDNGVNLTIKPVAGALWSPVPGTPSGSVDPYTGTGLSKDLFFAGFTAPTYPSNPDFAVTSGTLLTGFDPAVLFASERIGSFFDKTLTYKGAFGLSDWTNGWTEFQPLNKAY